MTRQEIRELWKQHGGSQHGPRVETMTMPEASFYLFVAAVVTAERARIADALDFEASTTPCAEDAVVVRDCANLVRADFSYDEAERLAIAQGQPE